MIRRQTMAALDNVIEQRSLSPDDDALPSVAALSALRANLTRSAPLAGARFDDDILDFLILEATISWALFSCVGRVLS